MATKDAVAQAFEAVARFPSPGDNVAIATRRLEAGTVIQHGDRRYSLAHTVLEGHRFAASPIAKGEALLSWGLPFGHATRPIAPGDYVCNAKILNSLGHRNIDFALPETPNFTDFMQRYELDEAGFRPGSQVAPSPEKRTFPGFAREGRRGAGTRNFVIVLGTTSLTASFARALAGRFQGGLSAYSNVDGVVAVTHTEGGGQSAPNNRDLLLRTLAGFMVHPNVGAVLAVDYGSEVISNAVLRAFMEERGYPLKDVLHAFQSVQGNLEDELGRGEATLRGFLPRVNAFQRSPQPAAELRLALQCGGSDAFSGLSANPLMGWVAKTLIRQGGAANLAETDELIGAEPYVLSNVRDLPTAKAFLGKIEAFKERAAWHGHSAEGNPSGGNQYRGLYNIAVKSLGAARKKDPEVRLDYVIDYGQPMSEPGYYFMDSPGNDLESIAGQVASGCNLILFSTGNGSITNFPFVPTLKFVTTTGRWQMLAREMDVNAGRYQDGTPMEALGQETFELALAIASGQPSLGEHAGHSQVSIWRDWRQTDASRVQALLAAPKPSGHPLRTKPAEGDGGRYVALRGEAGWAADQIGLIVPTSICSSQIARLISERLNEHHTGDGAVTRYVALLHTEGCGAAPGYSQQLYLRTALGHLTHPSVRRALLLEHGCEQTHNDAMREYLAGQGIDVTRLGWASVQLDGGIEKVTDKAERWFREALGPLGSPAEEEVGLGHLRLGLTATGEVGDAVGRALAGVARTIVGAGGLVVVPENAALLHSRAFREALLLIPDEAFPTLGYGQPASQGGLHVMETPTDHQVETLTGLGATGVEVMLVHVAGPPLQAHPMIPLLQVSADPATVRRFAKDLDRVLPEANGAAGALSGDLLGLVLDVASRRYTPYLFGLGHTDFQLTRGWLGLSL
jgi:altronate dehydratase